MSLEHIRGKRRVRIALAAGLVAALTATGISASTAFADQGGDPADAAVKTSGDKLGSADAELLAKAKAAGDKNVTMMIATKAGSTEQISGEIDALKGASVDRTYDKLGYVRATVPTGKADAAIAAAQQLSSVQAVDLKQEIKLDDPTPSADRAQSRTLGPPHQPPLPYGAPARQRPPHTP
ncbi:S8 family serine peptidase, partial [Streptomyces tubercidicus]